MKTKLTRNQKLQIYLKAAELIFDKEKYETNVTQAEPADFNIGRNMAFSGYCADLANQMISSFEGLVR
jgi:hypothetical protein